MNFNPIYKFDIVLIDAPCSSTGTIKRNPEILFRKEMPDLKKLENIQYRLLIKASDLLKKNGILIYAVCSIFKKEGIKQIERFLIENKNFEIDKLNKKILKNLIFKILKYFILRNYFYKIYLNFPEKNNFKGINNFDPIDQKKKSLKSLISLKNNYFSQESKNMISLELHSFDWLSDFKLLGGVDLIKKSRLLIIDWLSCNSKLYSNIWDDIIVARRLINLSKSLLNLRLSK